MFNRQSAQAGITLCLLAAASALSAQHVRDPHASLIDVPTRQAELRSTKNPRVRSAISGLGSCVDSPVVPAPASPINIPHHYLSGSHGPTNPAEAAATRVYGLFEKRTTAGMNQYLATGSHAEAACAQQQIDLWASGGALLDYDPKVSSQAWYQVEWTLSSVAITESVLLSDSKLDKGQTARDTKWINTSAHKLIAFETGEKNNHHYWRALAATAAGIISSDDALFKFGVETFQESVAALDERGAFPLEMARHERAIHYQAFALQPLIPIAEFAERQGIPLYSYSQNGRTIRDGVIFLGKAIDDPSIVKVYTPDAQTLDFGSNDYSFLEFYVRRFGTKNLPASIVHGLSTPTDATRIGGSTTVLAAK
jgi:poly(beta-D-mannuronate) lyase